MTKLASLSTSYLRIYEDDPNDPNNIDVPKVKEPTTNILHEMKLECLGCGSDPCGYGFQVQIQGNKKIGALNCKSWNDTGGSEFDILFDPTVDDREFVLWNEAVQKAWVLSRKSKTLLDELKSEMK